MTTRITQPDAYIQFRDNYGNTQNMSIKQCSELTGKSVGTIRYHYDRKKAGKIEITNRQIIGLDDYKWDNPGRPVKKKVNLDAERSLFNRRCLVAR